MAALTENQLSAAINNELQTQLTNQWGGDSSLGDTWLATGAYGGSTVYPQGQQGTATTASYYYPTFKAFDKTVEVDSYGVPSISETTLTSSLVTLYDDIYYGLSASQQNEIKDSAQKQANAVSSFWNSTWVPLFGSSSTYYKDAVANGDQSDWVTTITKDGDSNISPDLMLLTMQGSYNWALQQACANVNFAIKSDYRDLATTKPFDLMQDLTDQTLTYQQVFTGNLSFTQKLPWTQAMANELASIQADVGASTKMTGAQSWQNSQVNSATSILKAYVGNTAAQTQVLAGNKDNYVQVYTGGTDAQTGFPAYIPSPGAYTQTSDNVRELIQGTNTAGSDFSIYIDTASGNTVNIGVDTSSAQAYSVSASERYWFFSASQSAQGSSSTDTTFRSHDSNAAETSGTVDFKNSFYQTWSPPQGGNGSWLMLDAIESAFTNGVSNGNLPWTQSPNFAGGWGFTDAPTARAYLADGFQYIKSIAYTPEPTTTVRIASASDSSTFFNEDTFSQSSYAASGGIGFGNWLGGASISASASGSSSKATTTTTSSYNDSLKVYEVTNSGLGSTNQSPPLSYGYGALQIGVSVINTVPPMDSATVSDLSTSSSKVGTKYALGATDYKIIRGKSKVGYFVSDKSLSGEHVKFAGKKDDLFMGSRKEDHVSGSGGSDELYGWHGNDNIAGGGGSDFISGGYGKNYMHGGGGKDYFELDAAAISSNRKYKHVIGDFQAGKDVLWMTNDADLSLLSFTGKWITYDDEKVCKLLGATKSMMEMAVDSVESAMSTI